MSAREGGPRAVHMLIECRHGCGLIGSTPSYDVLRRVAWHFHNRHNSLGRQQHTDNQLIIEGVDYTAYPAPHRCDMCNESVEPPWWNHIATPPLGGVMANSIIDADGLWLLCDTCHGFYVQRDVESAIARNIEVGRRQSPGAYSLPGAGKVNSDVRGIFATLFDRLDEGERYVLGPPT